jgi:phosphohistidine phosphatase
MNHTLTLMRHAKSDWNTGASSDFERPLNKRGVKDAALMGAWLNENNLVPELIIASPALRAKQTTLSVAEQTGFPETKIIWDKRIYAASLSGLLEVITDYHHNTRSILLTGHCPGMDYLLEYLSRDKPNYTLSGKLMTTAAIAVLDFGKEEISTNEKSARLEKLLRPSDLK